MRPHPKQQGLPPPMRRLMMHAETPPAQLNEGDHLGYRVLKYLKLVA
ncbi:hypothetical protein PMI42_00544 [Bradyrhizobium sp. YR681]|nr:hypothetical protein PMI42_00544 [Bradyrhizobium sp. YR681]